MSLFSFGKKDTESQSQGELNPEQQKIINEEKQNMIRGIEDLSNTSVKEVMIPRVDADFISIDTQYDDLMEKIATCGHSRIPVYSESIDNVIGILYLKDLIHLFASKETINIEKILRKPFFVPESKRIDSLLREFKRRHLHIAIAIDEYGGVSGIVTMEDIIEEIVGDIQDEFDNEREDIVTLGNNIWLCDARVDIDDLNETITSQFPNEEFDTLGGFVFDLFGKIPVKYEKVSWNAYDFIVQDMEGHRINMIKVIKKNEDTDTKND